ncbi:acyl carrier protein [Lachnospiraceae bacterium]|nr:acyl carrier protein [Lachnospiraceae bacterium]
MSRDEVLEKITEVLRDEFEDDELEISDETTAADVDGWDSLAHLSIVHEIEKTFGIKLTMGEIQESKNVGELIDAIIRHIENK